jgi:hypothetical protein
MEDSRMIDETEYRVALILTRSRRLLGIRGSSSIELPVISIPLFRRAADQLTRRIKQQWKISAVVLDILAAAGSNPPCAVVEVRSDAWHFETEGFCVAELGEIGEVSLDENQRHFLGTILLDGGATNGAFSQIGWIDAAQRWIQSSVDEHEVVFNGEIRHLNGGGAFCLIRLGTQHGPAYWIKGVGTPNDHEFRVTRFLAEHCPEHLPPIVAMRTDWNAWAMKDFGMSLNNSDSLDDFKCAARELATLQKKLVARSEELLALSCVDHRIGTLDSKVDEIVEYLDGAMRQQTSTKVAPLTSSRLREIRNGLHDACNALQDLEIPDSLMHGDLSPGSILSHEARCAFTDWCEAYVGNPFISMEQFSVHVRRKSDNTKHWIPALKNVYGSSWTDRLTAVRVRRAIELVPLVSVLSYLYGRGDWLRSPRRDEPAVQSYARSLARHMDRITAEAKPQEALCPSN